MELRVNPQFGEAVRRVRLERHLSQVEAAAEIGVAVRTLQQWELNFDVMPHPKHRRAIIAWLNGEAEAA